MNKFVMSVLFAFFPMVVFADNSSLSFTPPVSDYSMVFLGNLFGVVDGVLNGTGSQIMGAMFSVFNSAVLALGGIIIMYTLIVSTMNTAHEGQMLGQKWSSIWIPVRSTAGLALLVPKASGYCLMQIFIMWVVAQGVGAADKVWDAALGYLNRGGAIVKAQSNPAQPYIDAANGNIPPVPHGAMTILVGQVCMLGVQNILEKERQDLLRSGKGNGNCDAPDKSIRDSVKTLCTTPVPDFLSTVNFINIASADGVNGASNRDSSGGYNVQMPNFDSGDYQALNGICGTIHWMPVDDFQLDGDKKTFTLNPSNDSLNNPNLSDYEKKKANTSFNLTATEVNAIKLTRAVAVQQMYINLSSVAQTMISNDPTFSSSSVTPQQFGVPYNEEGAVCTISGKCTSWGPAPGNDSSVLFNGGEFLGAISAYNAVMQPTLKLIDDMKNSANVAESRTFIRKASAQGWIMAGSYFFSLVKLSGNAADNYSADGTFDSKLMDTESGLGKSIIATPRLLCDENNTAQAGGVPNKVGYNSTLCNWLNQGSKSAVTPIGLEKLSSLIAGTMTSAPDLNARKPLSTSDASTVYGYIQNAMSVTLPGQPGTKPLTFANFMAFNVDVSSYRLQKAHFDCGRVTTFIFKFCLGSLLGNIFYNLIFYPIYNTLLTWFMTIVNQVIFAFVMVPVQGMAAIFKQGLTTISMPGVNPVVALANMGVMYINFSGNLWITLMSMSVTSSLIPVFGLFIFALNTFAMPLLLSWVGIMVSIGFTTAYYIPILPYMIFTFGSIAWLISVIEAMVAAPIVALGVTHPEGHDAFGKGEAAIMLLMNVFLRPSMMIIGYISGIALCYVGVWILNAGFDNAIGFIQSGDADLHAAEAGSGTGGYKDWAGVYAYFFGILIYTTIYLTIVQKSFTMIAYLPDKVLRWIGGSPESLGSEAAQWGDENVKGKLGEAAKATQDAQGQMGKQLAAGASEKGAKATGWVKDKVSKLTGGGKVGLK